MYKVMYWENQWEKDKFPETKEAYHAIQTHSTHANLKQAKKTCRKLGHTGEDDSMLTSFPPIAFVANSKHELIYNPRFKKN